MRACPGVPRCGHRSSPDALDRGKPRCEHRWHEPRPARRRRPRRPGRGARRRRGRCRRATHPELAPGGEGRVALGVQLARAWPSSWPRSTRREGARRRWAARCSRPRPGSRCTRCRRRPTARCCSRSRCSAAGWRPPAPRMPRWCIPAGGSTAPRLIAGLRRLRWCVLGLLPRARLRPARGRLLRVPATTWCSCTATPTLADWLATWGPRLAAVTWLALAVLILLRLVAAACRGALDRRSRRGRRGRRARPQRRRATSAPPAALAADTTDRDLWLATAGALGARWRPASPGARFRPPACAMRSAVSPSPRPTATKRCAPRSAAHVGDPDLRIVLPHPETGAPLGVVRRRRPARVRTAVERRGRVVAWLEHSARAPAPTELARSAGLMLERGALRAAQRLQQDELRASTAAPRRRRRGRAPPARARPPRRRPAAPARARPRPRAGPRYRCARRRRTRSRGRRPRRRPQ